LTTLRKDSKMQFDRLILNIIIFVAFWAGFDVLIGTFSGATVKECVAGVSMALLLYLDNDNL
jgi:hypothetical protein